MYMGKNVSLCSPSHMKDLKLLVVLFFIQVKTDHAAKTWYYALCRNSFCLRASFKSIPKLF